ncbi:tRNA(Ile)-lysidine synthase [Cricetibacter osteomyelitidis]|uniref:tRNA(Ile)-lysidine synthase n=1 Tax=Cricetibacter osteomyelitidis TaxID=1521931 RepID=A0A4R2T6G5_9PAST|nr:tRNA lysidine(34) synthetase TilS [Cricetibacter osteomyelitidis]TCP97705.1 tRNA(Ile)-lysidine synthase [Cricetibacter osteomyelitidis]
MPLITQIQQQIQQFYSSKQAFLIALSGGLDSMALLSLFVKLREKQPHFSLRAIHIHHGLSANANQWATHCQQYCEQLAVPLIVEKVKINTTNGIEAGAREARYSAIQKHLQKNEVLVTAHHQNDQTETFLLALKRGSGVQGLSAMAVQSVVYNVSVFRPLLSVSRSQLEDYAVAEKLTWVNDESNENSYYDRNFLRNVVLPQLRERWPYFDQAVSRTATHCAEQQRLLNELLQQEFRQIYDKTHRTLTIAQFSDYSTAKQKALLRLWLAEQQLLMPSAVQLERVLTDVIQAKNDRNPQFQLGGQIIRRYQQKLYLVKQFADLKEISIPLEWNKKIVLPDNLGSFILNKTSEKITALWQSPQGDLVSELPPAEQPMSVRFSYSGKVRLTEKSVNKDIKKIWQDLAVPPWQRQRIPLIFYGERLQSAVGFFTIWDH